MQFLTTEKAYVKYNFTIPRGSSIGFYARRNALPTHTQYDFKEILSGFNTRTSRAAYQPTIHRDVTRFMEAGFWFISLYNDDGHNQEVTFYASIAGEMMRNCPNGCNGNGNCIGGHCQCNAGFGGDSCNESKLKLNFHMIHFQLQLNFVHQAFVQFCAISVATTRTANATAIRAGKVKNVN